MTEKERVILAAQFDLVACRWSMASIDNQGTVVPLIQSVIGDLAAHRSGTFDERTSFLRHRIAGALQRGSDRLWGRSQKAELFAIEFSPQDVNHDAELIQRVAEHFCVWMVKPPVICLQTESHDGSSILAMNTESADQSRINTGLSTMRPLTSQSDLWETVVVSSQS